jgi:hypothetical protein
MKGHVGTHHRNEDGISRRPGSKDSSDRARGVSINQVHVADISEKMTGGNHNEDGPPLVGIQRKDKDISLIKTWLYAKARPIQTELRYNSPSKS